MLKLMRRHIKIFGIVLWLVIISFIVWGAGTIKDQSKEIIAIIGDYKVTVAEYQESYDRIYNMYKLLYPDGLSEELVKTLDIKRKALDDIIERRLLLEEAKRRGISVSEGEILHSIMSYPAFQKDGRFDKSIYFRTLEVNRLTPERFENMQREDLTIEKLKRIIRESVDFLPMGDADKDSKIKGVLILEKKEKAVISFVETLKKRTKIKINETFLS
ncbi:MAG: SurA N-terminal domain-containing protein [Nitrospirota bacterium]